MVIFSQLRSGFTAARFDHFKVRWHNERYALEKTAFIFRNQGLFFVCSSVREKTVIIGNAEKRVIFGSGCLGEAFESPAYEPAGGLVYVEENLHRNARPGGRHRLVARVRLRRT
jgi:hypothetical protein